MTSRDSSFSLRPLCSLQHLLVFRPCTSLCKPPSLHSPSISVPLRFTPLCLLPVLQPTLLPALMVHAIRKPVSGREEGRVISVSAQRLLSPPPPSSLSSLPLLAPLSSEQQSSSIRECLSHHDRHSRLLLRAALASRRRCRRKGTRRREGHG